MTTTRPSLSERLEAARAQQATAQAAELEANRTAADEMLSKLTVVIGDADDTIGEADTPEKIDAALTKLAQELQNIFPALTSTRTPAPADQRGDRPRAQQQAQTRSEPQQPEPRQPQTRREAQQQATPQPPSPFGQGGVSGWLGERTGLSLGRKRQH